MELQQAVVVAAIVLAAAYVARETWRGAFRASGGCGSGCGKCASGETPDATPGRISLKTVDRRGPENG